MMRDASTTSQVRKLGSQMKWFRGGLVFKAHRLVYHSTLGLGVIKKKNGQSEEGVLRKGGLLTLFV